MDETKLIAHLPGLDIELATGLPADGQGERVSIQMVARPSFAALGRMLSGATPLGFLAPPLAAAPTDAFNPWQAWGQFWLAAWWPWLSWLPRD